ncbi:hypothetical protein ANCCAN_21153 [Ancylostoma caninum]|uniref:Uncharacterized protein n=1 Tax=Ancylostoma caninum TaxID=29170 RepID=A0A368FQD7_ANCCA|nr:hypothetical protein ANCCAN_21153 [Ancylostoma caninum]
MQPPQEHAEPSPLRIPPASTSSASLQASQRPAFSLPGMGIQRQLPSSALYPPALLAQMFQPYFNGVFPTPEVAFHLMQPSSSTQQKAASLETHSLAKRMHHISEDRDSGNESLSYAGSPPLSGTSSNDSSRSNSFSVSALLKTEIVSRARPPVAAATHSEVENPLPSLPTAQPARYENQQIHAPTPMKPAALPPPPQGYQGFHQLPMGNFHFPHVPGIVAVQIFRRLISI